MSTMAALFYLILFAEVEFGEVICESINFYQVHCAELEAMG